MRPEADLLAAQGRSSPAPVDVQARSESADTTGGRAASQAARSKSNATAANEPIGSAGTSTGNSTQEAPIEYATAPAGILTPNREAELRRAASAGDISTLQTLLRAQADINSRDVDGRTPLMLATLNGQTRAVELLLARGADPNAADADGISPLQAALAGHRPAVATALRKAGAR